MYQKNSFTTFSLVILFLIVYNKVTTAQPIAQTVNLPDSIVNYAVQYIGKPYKWAGSSERGFDCSGFVSFVFGHFNIKTPRSSNDYEQFGTPIPLKNCQKGDIILFTGTDLNKSTVGHVGIVVSEKGEPIGFIHSSSSNRHQGVVITDYDSSGYSKRFIGIRRVLH